MPSDNEIKAWKEDQLIRSEFFHRKLHEYGLLEIAYELESIKGEKLDWKIDLSITPLAWDKVIHKGIKPIRVFAHPQVLKENPKRVSYYRMLSMVSQKSMNNVGLSINGCEIYGHSLDSTSSLNLSKYLNKIICMLIENDDVIDEREFDLWRAMAAGTQAQGSWQNIKGNKAEILIKDTIEKRLKETNQMLKEGLEGRSKVSNLRDGRILRMGSEPDLAFYRNGKIEMALEIKGGIDTAGALERFGAALKSLRRAKLENPEAITILLMHEASITARANGEIDGSIDIDHLFTIGDMISSDEKRSQLFKILKI
jgi:hypothetical protein